jgi:hypothetical protein
MNYYTPELIEMGRSSNDQVLDEQDRLWAEAAARYSRYIAEVKDSFPEGLRRLFSRYYLHDATIHRIAQKERYFLIELQLDTPPRSFLLLRYRLLRPVETNKEALPLSCRAKGPEVDWIYAEVERLSSEEVLRSPFAASWVKDDWLAQAEHAEGTAGSEWPFWVHHILLSNGWEFAVYFHDIKIDVYETLLSAAVNGHTLAPEAARQPTSGS